MFICFSHLLTVRSPVHQRGFGIHDDRRGFVLYIAIMSPEQRREKSRADYHRYYRRKKQSQEHFERHPPMYPGLTYEAKCLLDEERIANLPPAEPGIRGWFDTPGPVQQPAGA